MIWQASSPGGGDHAAMCAYLRAQLADWTRGRLLERSRLDDVAAVVAVAWRQDLRGIPLPPDALALMAARALWRIGEREAVRALAEGLSGASGDAGRLLELVESGGPSLPACIGLGARVLRPARSASAGADPCWTLELAGLTTPAGDLAEIGLPVRVRRVLAGTAEIWDRTSGGGWLGIARPPPGAADHLARLIRRDLPGLCRLVLARLQAERGWTRCPAVGRAGL